MIAQSLVWLGVVAALFGVAAGLLSVGDSVTREFFTPLALQKLLLDVRAEH